MKLLPVLVLLLWGGLAVSCKRSEPTPARLAAAHRQQDHAKDSAHRWFTTNLVGAYERVGQHDPQWDGPAKTALNLMAAGRSGEAKLTTEWSRDVSSLAQSAVDHGCTDPLVRYVALRYRVGDMKRSDAETAKAFQDIAADMGRSGYSPYLNFYALMRAAESLKATLPENNPPQTEMALVHELRRQSLQNLLQALHDPTTPESEIYVMSSALMEMVRLNDREFPEYWSGLDATLRDQWPKSAQADLLRGWYYRTYAWQARGSGFADKVTPEGARLFDERLKLADQALQSGWKKDNTDTRIATEMIKVCTGLGKDRAEMELWFQRAMLTAPDNYDACQAKLHYLKPIWFGSSEEMLAFGHECVSNTNWSGRVPLVLTEAHGFLSAYGRNDSASRQAYWLQPEVWPDLRAAYEAFFRKEPDAVGWRPNYTLHAYKCQAWDDLNAQLQQLGPVNYNFFGGRAAFDRMVAEAKNHAKP